MTQAQKYEGTWEEVNAQLKAHAEELRQYKWLRLVIEPQEEAEGTVPTGTDNRAPENKLPRDPALVARVRSARGKFARPGAEMASEQLHQERQADKLKEEQQISRSPL